MADDGLVPAVFDAEFVDEPEPAVYYSPKLGRLRSWWLRAPWVPSRLKSAVHARQWVRDVVSTVVRSPWYLLSAVVRGLVVGIRLWRRWVTVREFRDAAELSEKLADKFSEIRELTLFRWKSRVLS